MKTQLFYLFAAAIVVSVSTPVARSEQFLVPQWTPYTQRKTAHCMIAEADENQEDHIAIAYAAFNLWQFRKQRFPRMRYVDLLNAYCSVHKLSLARLSKRQRWIRQLDFPILAQDGEMAVVKPKDFPRKASWKRKRRIWIETLKLANQWNRGELKDPCNGQAVHWGAPSDPKNKWYLPSDVPGKKLVRLRCSDNLLNDYYRFRTKADKLRKKSRRD